MRITEVPYNDILKLRQEVMYPDKDIDFVKLEDDEKGLHFGVYLEHELVSIVSIFLEGRDLQFRKLATVQNMQGKGYASKLMKWVLDYAKDVKLNRVWCNARTEAVGFYEQFGYEQTKDVFTKNGHDYVVMEKVFT